ncbi:MAG: amidohydrolase family protein, partial [Candidatus Thorarchaeota archaeon]
MVNRTLIENGMIVTGDSKGTIIPSGHILIEENRIVEVESGKFTGEKDTVINADDCVIIPGLITAHTHLYGILLRGASLNIEPPKDFAQILQRVWWPVDEALTLDDAKASALAASADMLRNGSTFFADTYS